MMKKQNLKISTLWMMLGLLPSIGFAQNFQPNAPVPLDKAVTHGILSNEMQ